MTVPPVRAKTGLSADDYPRFVEVCFKKLAEQAGGGGWHAGARRVRYIAARLPECVEAGMMEVRAFPVATGTDLQPAAEAFAAVDAVVAVEITDRGRPHLTVWLGWGKYAAGIARAPTLDELRERRAGKVPF